MELEERIKEIDAKLAELDEIRHAAARWGEYLPESCEEMDLVESRNHLIELLSATNASKSTSTKGEVQS